MESEPILIDFLAKKRIILSMTTIYIIKEPERPKIGITDLTLTARRGQLQCGNSRRLEVFRGWQHDNRQILEILEEVVKIKLDRKRLESEFFEVTPEYMARVILETARTMKIELKEVETFGSNPWKKKVREKEARKHDKKDRAA